MAGELAPVKQRQVDGKQDQHHRQQARSGVGIEGTAHDEAQGDIADMADITNDEGPMASWRLEVGGWRSSGEEVPPKSIFWLLSSTTMT